MSYKKYTVYSDVGKIVKTVTCLPCDIQVNTKEGQFYVEGIGNSQIQKVVDGKIIDKTSQELATEKAEKELQVQQRQDQNVLELRSLLASELAQVDPAVISLLKKLELLPKEL